MAFTKRPAIPAKDPYTVTRIPQGCLHRYNILAAQPLFDWEVELMAWVRKLDTGMGGYHHLKRASEILMPDFVWHPWRERVFQLLCDDEAAYKLGGITIRNISLVGCGASSKTHTAACLGFLFFMAAAHDSYVIMTSTSKTKMRQRGWPIIQECFASARNVLDAKGAEGPHMLNSTMELQAEKGDAKHAIFGQAIEPGELDKAVQAMRGVHASRIMVFIDEADGTPDAIYATIPNMLKGCKEFVLINSSNGPMTHLDTFSRVCAPAKGWGSVSVESERWATQEVPEFQLPRGVCLHFDGKKSPNVTAGRTIYPFLYTHENWMHVADKPDVQNTVTFWSQERGFWPPEGFANTVFNEVLVSQHGGQETEVPWIEEPVPCAALDPAFGGDDCVLQLGLVGEVIGRKRVLLLRESLLVPFDPQSTLSIDGQIARWVKAKCLERRVAPEMFGLDATGTGRGVAAWLNDNWSAQVVKVEFGGGAGDEAASLDDPRPCKEVYANQVTRLWWQARDLLVGGQLKGLGKEAVKQFCSRIYEYASRKYRVETKPEMKDRMGRSPDQADVVAVLVEVVRRNARVVAGGTNPKRPRDRAWDEAHREQARLTEASAGYSEGREWEGYHDPALVAPHH